jgi:glutaredoxin-like protein
MKLLNKKTMDELEKIFKDFKRTINVKFFGEEQSGQSRFCKETRELLEEVSKLSGKINLETFVFDEEKDAVEQYNIKRIPAIVVMGEEDYGIRFYGVPGGYEFSSFVESLKLISYGETMLVQDTKDFLDSLDKDVHLQVFVTPTCPHCPTAVVLGHRMAYYSPKVTADMIESTEFPEMAQKYQVMGVPRTIINEDTFQEGAVPEDHLVEKIKAAVS